MLDIRTKGSYICTIPYKKRKCQANLGYKMVGFSHKVLIENIGFLGF